MQTPTEQPVTAQRSHWVALGVTAAAGLPGVLLRFGAIDASLEVGTVLFAITILAAAFILSWAAEVAQLDISKGLAIAFLAFIAVLPEYAVGLVYAWKAGQQDRVVGALTDLCGSERCGHLALANMTGANRLLIGLGWATVVLIWARRSGNRELHLAETARTDIGFLVIASLWAFTIPIRGVVAWYDLVFLVGIFAFYMWHVAQEEQEHPDLIGPPVAIASLGVFRRRAITIGLFVLAAAAILASAEPFAEGLVHIGGKFHISSFLLVQWLAPLASEAPEMIIAILFVLRAKPQQGLGALVSSKVNQWTLLVGTVPLVYALSRGSIQPLSLGGRQSEEVLLTAAQSLFACAVLANLSISRAEASGLLVLFLVQFGFQSTAVRYGFAIAYMVFATVLLISSRSSRTGMWMSVRHALRRPGTDPPSSA